MKVIIAGSRSISDHKKVSRAIKLAMSAGIKFDEVVTGGAKGVDTVAHRLAEAVDVPTSVFNADWGKHGKAAGPIRNRRMADYADALVAVWDGESRGTRDMIRQARKTGLEIFVVVEANP